MKTDRYSLTPSRNTVKLISMPFAMHCRPTKTALQGCCYSLLLLMALGQPHVAAQVTNQNQTASSAMHATGAPSSLIPSEQPSTNAPRIVQSDPDAIKQLNETMRQLAYGPAFYANIRQRVWAAGREVLGTGAYEQAGNGTGHYNLQVTMYDGDGKVKDGVAEHMMQQISDGRLAWTKTKLGSRTTLSRVDVGRLSEWVRQAQRSSPQIEAPNNDTNDVPLKLKVGAWMEILDSIKHDYVLDLGYAHAKSNDDEGPLSLVVITAKLSEVARKRIQQENHISAVPELFPTTIKIAIRTTDNKEFGFGKGLPVRFEYWSDPVKSEDEAEERPAPQFKEQGRLISLIELYSIQEITPPQIGRFRFEANDSSINFTNDTDRYLRKYGIRMTEARRQQMR